jgi:hypothetical protein
MRETLNFDKVIEYPLSQDFHGGAEQERIVTDERPIVP